MTDDLRKTRAAIARQTHERLAQRAERAKGREGVTALRQRVHAALHERMKAELEASR